MTKRRAIYGTAATSLSLAHCSIEAQLLFDRLITAADDQGRLQGDPLIVKASCVPLLKVFTVRRVDWCLKELTDNGMLIRYEAHEQPMVQIVKWWEHQDWMRHAYPSRWPAPEGWQDRLKGGGAPQDDGTPPASRAHGAGISTADGRHDAGLSESVSGDSDGVKIEASLSGGGNGADAPPRPANIFLQKTLTTHFDQTGERPNQKGSEMYLDLLEQFGYESVSAAQWAIGPGKGYGYIAKVKAACKRAAKAVPA